MAELIMLGTGIAMVTRCYNTCFAIKNDEEYFLVDAGGGNGIMGQLEKAGISYEKMHHMFVTHGHTDHILGAIWVIRTYAELMLANKYAGVFTVYGHDEVVNMLNTFCEMLFPGYLLKYINNNIFIKEVKDGDILQVNGLQLTFFDIASTKAKQFGFQAILPDGQKLVCLGDEPYQEVSRQYVEKADWLLAEAFCLYAEREIFRPYEKHHSTAMDAGKLARQLGVKNLLLYHTEDTNLENRKALYTREAKSVFNGAVYVPDDLEKINL